MSILSTDQIKEQLMQVQDKLAGAYLEAATRLEQAQAAQKMNTWMEASGEKRGIATAYRSLMALQADLGGIDFMKAERQRWARALGRGEELPA